MYTTAGFAVEFHSETLIATTIGKRRFSAWEKKLIYVLMMSPASIWLTYCKGDGSLFDVADTSPETSIFVGRRLIAGAIRAFPSGTSMSTTTVPPPIQILRPLRFGVMCPATGLTEFACKCIDDITRDRIAEPVLLILAENAGRRRLIGPRIRESIRQGENLWHLQTKLFPPSRIEAFRTQPLDECLPGIERIACQPERKGKWSQYFRAGDVVEIRSRNLDFILKFAYGIIRGEILQVARYGVWSFHHGDEEKYRGRPPGFWEIYHGDPITGAILQRLTDRLDGGIVLKKCFVSTNGVSFRANLQRIHESSWHMVRPACQEVIRGDLSSFQAAPSRTVAPIYRAPNDLQMMRFWMRLAGNWFRRKFARQRVDEFDEFNVGVVNSGDGRAQFGGRNARHIHWERRER